MGGGVITDLGGFVASTFKRGIELHHIPTSLLAMIDAAWGGKTAVNIGANKNQMGTFYKASAIYILPQFLLTLEKSELQSGYGELFKHALIEGIHFWQLLKDSSSSKLPTDKILKKAIEVKNKIVATDPFEANERKKLNLGHSFGHAFESYYLKNNQTTTHGLCVAKGIFTELELSKLTFGNRAIFSEIQAILKQNFPIELPPVKDFELLLEFMSMDKKNEGKNIKFVLLKDFGDVLMDFSIATEIIKEAYKNAHKSLESNANNAF